MKLNINEKSSSGSSCAEMAPRRSPTPDMAPRSWFDGFNIDFCLFLKCILRYMLIDIVTRLRIHFAVELIMQGVLSFTVHRCVIPCTAVSFSILTNWKKAGGRGVSLNIRTAVASTTARRVGGDLYKKDVQVIYSACDFSHKLHS